MTEQLCPIDNQTIRDMYYNQKSGSYLEVEDRKYCVNCESTYLIDDELQILAPMKVDYDHDYYTCPIDDAELRPLFYHDTKNFVKIEIDGYMQCSNCINQYLMRGDKGQVNAVYIWIDPDDQSPESYYESQDHPFTEIMNLEQVEEEMKMEEVSDIIHQLDPQTLDILRRFEKENPLHLDFLNEYLIHVCRQRFRMTISEIPPIRLEQLIRMEVWKRLSKRGSKLVLHYLQHNPYYCPILFGFLNWLARENLEISYHVLLGYTRKEFK